ncbi:membrane protein FxsA [Halobacteriales archaeon QH_2_65_14]|nr:MAG: membrane protein FxsA [Halobacteriales archaeon QH_2_65_14]
MLRYIGLLLLIPLLDALFLVVLTAYLGWQLVVLLVVLTAFLGLLLARMEGRHTLRKIQRKAARGEAPTDELMDGALLLVAGAFLLTPGLVTDGVGFCLLVPLTRYPIRVALKKWVVVPYLDRKTGGFASGSVYIGGFPGEDSGGSGTPPGDGSGPDDPDDGFGTARDVEFEEIDDSG